MRNAKSVRSSISLTDEFSHRSISEFPQLYWNMLEAEKMPLKPPLAYIKVNTYTEKKNTY